MYSAESSISENGLSFTYLVVYLNRAPVITNPRSSLPSLTEDTSLSDNRGVRVFDLAIAVGNDTDDLDLGLAINQSDQTNGVWQYRSYNSSIWMDFPDTINIGDALQLNSNTWVRFVPNEYFFGESQFTARIWDMSNENSNHGVVNVFLTDPFTGSYSVNSAILTISITPINDPPQVYLGVNEVTYTEAASAIQIFPELNITDIDNSELQSATIILECPSCIDNSGDLMSFSGTDYSTTTGDMIISQGVIPFHLQIISNNSIFSEYLITAIVPTDRSIDRFTEYLQTLYFTNSDTEPVNQSRVISLSVNDGVNSSNIVMVVVSITLVNDEPPTVTLPFQSFTYIENSGLVQLFTLDSHPVVFDLDQNNPLLSAVIQLAGADFNAERIVVNCSSYLLTCSEPSVGTITINGSASAEVYNDVFNSLSYENSADEPDLNPCTISFSVFDGLFSSQNVSLTILTEFINDQLPVITPVNSSVVFHEDNPTSPPVAITSGLIIVDPDNGRFPVASIQAQLTDPLDQNNEQIGFLRNVNFPDFVEVDNISPYYVMLSIREGAVDMNDVPITGLPPTIVQRFLQSLMYFNRAEQPSGENRTVVVTVSDNFTLTGLQVSTPAVIFITFELLDDLPEVELNAIVVLYTEGQSVSQVFVAPNATVSDVDNANISGVTIEIISQSGTDISQEVLRVDLSGDGSIVEDEVSVGNQQYIFLTGVASLQAYASVLRSLTYEHLIQIGNPDPGNRVIRVTPISLTGEMGVSDEVTVGFTAIDNPPLLDLNGLASPGNNYFTVFEEEGAPIYVTSRNLVLQDVDSAQLEFIQITLSTGEINMERIFIDSDINTTITIIDQTNTTSILLLGRSSPINEFEALLFSLQYVNQEDEPSPGERNVSIIVSDGNGLTEAITVISISLVNDAPQIFLNDTEVDSYVTFIENGPAVSLSVNPQVFDSDSGFIELRIRPQFTLPGDEISADANLYFDQSFGYYYVNFSSSSLSDTVEQLISSIVFTNNMPEPEQGDRIFCLSVVDQQLLSSTEACSRVRIRFVNDNNPVFQQLPYVAQIEENTPSTSVIRVIAIDNDSLNTPVQLNYNIIHGDDCMRDSSFFTSGSGRVMGGTTNIEDDLSPQPCRFMIDTFSGQISTTDSPPDREMRSLYLLTVAVSDGVNEGLAVVNVTIIDVNDVAPRFQPEFYSVTIPLGSPADSVLANISVVDPDNEEDVTIFLMNIDPSRIDIFQVVRNGTLLLSIPENMLDPEVSRYTLTISALDSAFNPSSNMAVVEVNVILNDADPVFNNPSYNISVLESAPVGSVVLQISATDSDSGSNAEITYSIEASDFVPFSINIVTGEITVTSALDYETVQSFTFTVVASDGGRISRSSTAVILIQVLNVNEDSPSFTQIQYSGSVCEGAPLGYEILRVFAQDTDAGSFGEVTYVLVDEGNSAGRLAVNGTTGVVTVAAPLNFEDEFMSFIIAIQAMDGGGRFSPETEVMIFILNDNEFSPEFLMRTFEVTIPENYPVGNPLPLIGVSQSLASDNDGCNIDQCNGSIVLDNNTCSGSNSLVYDIASGNEAGLFNIHSLTGIVYLRNNLDFDLRGDRFFSLELTVNDGEFNSSAVLLVIITDFNDNLPIFENSSYSITIPESVTVGTIVLTVSATDIDPTSIILYSLSGEGSNDFNVDSDTGVVSTASTLHFETVSVYDLIVLAMNPDSDENNSTAVAVSLTVFITDINNNPPVFSEASYRFFLQENSNPGVIGGVIATDLDAGNNALIEYSITSINPGNLSLFTINSSSGFISTQFSFDREQTETYRLIIQGRDSGELPLSASVEVVVEIQDINDNPPLLVPEDYFVEIDEDVPVNYTVIIVNGTDLDNPDAGLMFQIINSRHFLIDENGVIFVAVELDRELRESYNLTVQVTDLSIPPLTSLATVQIVLNDVNDNPPSFSVGHFSAFIPENPVLPYPVININATDRDVGSNAVITYSLNTTVFPFEIDPDSGLVTVSRASDIDRETVSSYYLQVIASNNDGLSSSASLEINILDVNDNAPTFTEEVFFASVDEDFTPVSNDCINIIPSTQIPEIGSGMNRYVTTVTAIDRDEPNTLNSQIIYSLISVSPAASFTINSNNGDVYVTQILDRECFSSYDLLVEASDSNVVLPLTSRARVTVSVTDINDNSPAFQQSNYSLNVSESVLPEVSFFQFVASDPDTGINSELIYSLGPNSFPFVIEATSGRIYSSAILDRENISLYTFEVIVQDNGMPSFRADAFVEIVIDDANDNPPILNPSRLSLQLEENLPVETVVATFTVTDVDGGDSVLSLSGQPSSFSIVGRDLVVSGPLDFETNPFFNFEVIARNVEYPFLFTIAMVQIQLINLNDNPPIVTFSNSRVDYFERNKRLVLDVNATIIDDDGRNNTILVDGIVAFSNPDPREPSSPFIPNTRDLFLPYNCPLEDTKDSKFGPCNLPVLDDHFFTRPSLDLMMRNLDDEDVKSKTIVFTASKEQYAYTSIDRNFIETGLTISTWVWFVPVVGGTAPLTIVAKSSPNLLLYSLYCTPDGLDLRFQYRDVIGEREVSFIGACARLQGAWNHLAVVLNNMESPLWRVVVYLNAEFYDEHNISAPVDYTGSVFVGTRSTRGVNDARRDFFNGRLHLLLFSYSIANHNEINCAIGCGVSIISTLETTPLYYRYDYNTQALTINGRETVDVYEQLLNSFVLVLPLIEPVSSSYSLSYTVQDESFNLPTFVQIELHPVNDHRPVLNLSDSGNYTAIFVEEGGPVSAVNETSFFLTDRDLVAFIYVITVTIYNPQPQGSTEILEVRNVPTGMNVTFVNYTITLSGDLPLPLFQDVLRTITYNNLDNEPAGDSRLLIFTVSDTPEDDVTAFTVVEITSINDVPVLTVEFRTDEYSEGDGAVQFIQSLSITDSDSTSLVSGVVRFNIFDSDVEILSVNSSNSNIVPTYNRTTGTLTLTGEDTLANYSAVLQSLSYQHANMNPTAGTRIFFITVSDGVSDSPDSIPAAMLFFSVINDRPVIDLNGRAMGFDYSIDFIEDTHTSIAAVSPDATLVDVDNINLVNVTIILSPRPDTEEETLIVSIPQSDGSIMTSTGVELVLSSENADLLPINVYQTIIRSLQYQNLAEEPTPVVRMIQFVAHDGLDASLLATTQIIIQATNDVPVLDIDSLSPNPGYQSSFMEEGENTFITSRNVTITDNDHDATISIVMVVIQNTLDGLDESIVSTDPSIVISVFPSSNSATFIITLRNGSLEAVRQLLTTLQYSNRRDEPSEETRVLTISVSDGISFSNSEIVLLRVEALNDNAPQFLQLQYSRSILEELDPEVNVTTVRAVDLDDGPDGEIVYNIINSNPLIGESHFRIDSSGIIFTTVALDRERIDFYILNISATDNGNVPQMNFAIVEITVLDINDQVPIFRPETLFELSVSENSDVGTLVATVEAIDGDLGENAIVTYSLAGISSRFSILENGRIEVAGPLDADVTNPVYTITIAASDNGTSPLTSIANFTITVSDVNDNVPQFNESRYSGELAENAPPGTSVLTVTAFDLDSGTNGQITYILRTFTQPAQRSTRFTIDEFTGVITNLISFDREDDSEENIYSLAATIIDNGIPRLANQMIRIVTITITDENDIRPTFSSSVYTESIDENIPPLTPVLQVSATDGDIGLNSQIRYFIIPNSQVLPLFASNPFFSINSFSGEIFVNESVDFELEPVITFTVEARDMGRPPLTGNASVIITVRDLNDNSPQFDESLYQVSVAEDVPVGTAVLTITASDADSDLNGDVSYTLTDTTNSFSIDQTTGVIINVVPLDFESDCFYRLLVTGMDNGSPMRNSTALVDVSLLPVHDLPPSFSAVSYSRSVVENTPVSSSILQVSATDEDVTTCSETDSNFGSGELDLAPDAPQTMNNFQYFLLNHNDVFSIGSETGLIENIMVLDHEEASQYVLRVQARDPENLTSEVSVTINILDVNDNVPLFTQSQYTATVSENMTVGTTIIQVMATDADSIDQGRLIYSVRDFTEFFTIDNRTGAVIVSEPLDFETIGDSINFVVMVTDTGSNFDVAIVVLTITDLNDIPPMIRTPPRSLNFTEGEVRFVPFTEVFISDSDSFQVLCSATVTLTTPQTTNTVSQCACSNSTDITTCTPGCFEFIQIPPDSFPGSVMQTENGTVLMLVGNYSIANYTSAIQSIEYINLLSNPIPQPRTISVYVFDCVLPSNILTRTIDIQALNVFPPAVDLSGPDEIGTNFSTFFRERGPPVAIASPDAVITDEDMVHEREELTGLDIWISNPQDGEVESLILSRPFSHATITFVRNSSHSITFTGVGLLSDYTSILMQIRYSNLADEPVPSPERIVNVVAHEYHLSSSISSTVIQFITSNDHPPVIMTSPPRENRETSFLEGTTGIAITSNDAFISDLDSSNDPISELRVYVISSSQYNRIYTLDTHVLPPSITLNQTSNSSINFTGTASRSDYDNIIRGLMYHFTGDEFESIFPPKFVYLRVVDPQYSTFSVVQISPIPVNDQVPVFTESSYRVEIPENATIGFSIVKVSAVDGDRFSDNDIRYSILAGNEEGFFEISSTNGIIYLNQSLDFEMVRFHRLIITVTDLNFVGLPPPTPSTATVSITLQDVNDQVPMFSSTDYNATIGESVPIGTFVLQVHASDEDSTQHSQLEFEIVNITDFIIEPHTGRILTDAEIDREKISFYSFLVRVRNPGVSAFDTTRVTITVLDLDDNPPILTLDPNMTVLQEPYTSVPLSFNLDITDLDPNPSLDYAIIQILPSSNGSIVGELYASVGSEVITVSGNESSTLVFVGESQSLEEYINILRGVFFQDEASEPVDIDRVIAYQVGSDPQSDQLIQLRYDNGEMTSNVVNFTVTVSLINDNSPQLSLDSRPQGPSGQVPPACDGIPGSYSTVYIEDGLPVALSHSSLSISDDDSGENFISRAVVEIENPQDGDLERLSINLPSFSPLSVSTSESTHSRIVLIGVAPPEDYEAALRLIL